uniref:Uncharacterized protein n=1 Tax=Anguilla anguilla TaxID=7936 RepID=A0A0E9V7C7_ANGAN
MAHYTELSHITVMSSHTHTHPHLHTQQVIHIHCGS